MEREERWEGSYVYRHNWQETSWLLLLTIAYGQAYENLMIMKSTEVQTLSAYYQRQTHAHIEVDTPRSLVAHVLYSHIQNGRPIVVIQCRKWCISATKQFQRNPHKPLLPVEFAIWFSGHSRGEILIHKHTDRQTNPTTVTFAARACRELMVYVKKVHAHFMTRKLQWNLS